MVARRDSSLGTRSRLTRLMHRYVGVRCYLRNRKRDSCDIDLRRAAKEGLRSRFRCRVENFSDRLDGKEMSRPLRSKCGRNILNDH